jgi:hypothetical protein
LKGRSRQTKRVQALKALETQHLQHCRAVPQTTKGRNWWLIRLNKATKFPRGMCEVIFDTLLALMDHELRVEQKPVWLPGVVKLTPKPWGKKVRVKATLYQPNASRNMTEEMVSGVAAPLREVVSAVCDSLHRSHADSPSDTPAGDPVPPLPAATADAIGSTESGSAGSSDASVPSYDLDLT